MNLPVFVLKIVVDERTRPPTKCLHFNCACCKELASVDAGSGLCVSCWRVVVLAPAAMKAEAST